MPGNGCVVTGEKNLWDGHVFKNPRPGILSMFQQPAAEAVIGRRLPAAKDSWKQANNGIKHDKCGQLTTCEDIISDGDFLVHVLLTKALIHTFVPTTDKNQLLMAGKPLRHSLVKLFADGTQEDNSRVSPFFSGCAEAAAQGLWFHHHAFATAKGAIIGHGVTIRGIFPNVMYSDLDLPVQEGTTNDPLLEGGDKKLRKNS
jgi:hypothetical protein